MATDNFRKIILARMHALLKPMGFRKKDGVFSADVNDVVLFVQLQSSRYATKDQPKVTVNVGIFSRTVAERMGNTREPNFLDAHWNERIGFFMPAGKDKWWEITDESEAHVCGAEITNALASRALPEMQSLASTETLKSLWKAGKSRGLTEYQRNQYLKALSDSDSGA